MKKITIKTILTEILFELKKISKWNSVTVLKKKTKQPKTFINNCLCNTTSPDSCPTHNPQTPAW